MVFTSNSSLFFELPLELREHIYKMVAVGSSYGTDLVRTCRQFHQEAQKFLYQKPLTFSSQHELHCWISRADPRYLVYAAEIHVAIQDINLKSLLTPHAIAQQHDSETPRLQIWDLYDADLMQFQNSLEQLPKLQNITLRALPGPQSHFYQSFVNRLLGLIGAGCSGLTDLRLEGNFHQQDLRILCSMKSLQSFSFDGFSSSSPMDAAATLSSLEHLSTLSLISQHTMLKRDSQPQSIFSSKQQSITGDVVKTMQGLKYFQMTERVPSPTPTLFFTTDILASLHNHEKLRHLSILLSYIPDNDTMLSLEAFLQTSSIERLELDWPSLDPSIFTNHQILSNALQDVWIRANRILDASKILISVARSKEDGNIRQLRRVVLMRTAEYCSLPPDVTSNQESSDKNAVFAPNTVDADVSNSTKSMSVTSLDAHDSSLHRKLRQ